MLAEDVRGLAKTKLATCSLASVSALIRNRNLLLHRAKRTGSCKCYLHQQQQLNSHHPALSLHCPWQRELHGQFSSQPHRSTKLGRKAGIGTTRFCMVENIFNETVAALLEAAGKLPQSSDVTRPGPDGHDLHWERST